MKLRVGCLASEFSRIEFEPGFQRPSDHPCVFLSWCGIFLFQEFRDDRPLFRVCFGGVSFCVRTDAVDYCRNCDDRGVFGVCEPP